MGYLHTGAAPARPGGTGVLSGRLHGQLVGGGMLRRVDLLPPGYVLALDLTDGPRYLKDGSGNPVTSTGTVVARIYDIDGFERANQIASPSSRATWIPGDGLVTGVNSFYNILSAITLSGDITVGFAIKKTASPFYVIGGAAGYLYAQVAGTSTYFGNSATAGFFSNAGVGANRHIETLKVSSGVKSARLNGASAAVTHYAAWSGPLLTRLIGDGSAAGNCVARIGIFLRALDASEMSRFEQWLAQPYGINLT